MHLSVKALVLLGLDLGVAHAEEDAYEFFEQHYDEEEGGNLEVDEGLEEGLTDAQLEGIFRVMDAKKTGKVPVADIHVFWREMLEREMNHSAEHSYFFRLDSNKDGKVSWEELLASEGHQDPHGESEETMQEYNVHDEAKFKAADKNQDGFLEKKEFGAFESPEIDDAVEDAFVRAIFGTKDKDGDGSLTLEEFHLYKGEELSRDDFAKLDTNGDGRLQLEELKAWETGRHLPEEALKFVAETADVDKDGFVTLQEFLDSRRAIDEHEAAGYQFQEWATQLEL